VTPRPSTSAEILAFEVAVNSAINLLVDVYPQVVGSVVDKPGRHVNDTVELAAVHVNDIALWFAAAGRPQPKPLSVLACKWLSTQSTDAMTNDEPSYSRMANCTSISRATSVDSFPKHKTITNLEG
jgi:hypothetical protein